MPSRRLLAASLAVTLFGGLAAPAAAHDLYPDLGMARLADIYLTLAPTGQKQLRFSATIVNVGGGPFGVAATRNDASSAFAISQRVHSSDGTSRLLAKPTAGLTYAGDGHNHWHVRDLERYELRRLDNGVKVGTSSKSGFCFFDTGPFRLSLPGAPSTGVFSSAGCGVENSLDLNMGLSVGWGDTYRWTLPDQFIDVTNLSSGKYRLHATADPLGWFDEASEQNNATWVDLSLTVNRKGVASMKIIGYGPTA